jgi:tetratricopeptide (TPR) repeat protein
MERQVQLTVRFAIIITLCLFAGLRGQAPVNSPDTLDVLDSTTQADILDQLEMESAEARGPSLFKKLLESLGIGGSKIREGEKAYAKKDYDLSLQKFMEARLDRPESQELSLNIGNAQYKKKKYDKAIEAYKEALFGKESKLAADAYYNLGNANFRKGEFAIQQGDQQGLQHYRTAMAMYKKSLEINPNNKDAKQNIEVVQIRIKELLERQKQQQQQQQNGKQQPPPEPSEKAREVLARAMQLVKQRRYQEAKQLLEAVIREDLTAAGFQSYVQRIDDILGILSGTPPAPPATRDPRSQQQGLGVI